MKNKSIYCLFILLMSANSMVAQDTWQQVPNFPGSGGGRYASVGIGIGNKGYVGFGTDDGGNYYQDLWEYNPSTSTWTQKADFPGGARNGMIAFSLGNIGYFGTGANTPGDFGWLWYRDIWAFDPAANTWTQKNNFGGQERYLGVAFTIGGKAYIGTGAYRRDRIDYAHYLNDFWEYDPAVDTWTRKADVPEQGRDAATGFSIGNKGYIGLGVYYYDTRQKDLWEYDPAADSWTRKADLPGTQRYAAVGFSIGNKGYVGTGGYYSVFNDLWEYDQATDSWAQKASMGGVERSSAVGFNIGNKGYVGLGGTNSGSLSDFWEYSPEPVCEGWTQQPDLPQGDGRYGSVAVGVGNFGYMGLGAGNNGYLSDFWKYEPLTKTWTQVADFPGGARQAGVAFGIADKAYVGTGITSPYILFSDLYEYTPSSNTWLRKADYPGGGRYTAMSFSIGNRGYIGGGKDNGFTYGTTDFWEYNPATDTWIQKADIGTVRRSTGVGFSIGNKGYIGLGFQDYDTRRKDLLEYDPATDAWTQKADLPATERWGSIAFTLGNKGYIGAGYYYSPFNDIWEYNPAMDTWKQRAALSSTGRGQGIGLAIGNKGYAGFGYNSSIILNDFWEYSPGLDITCPPAQTLCFTSSNTYTIPPLIATSNCDIQSITYTITGATNRSGTGTNASGTFAPGTSMINWTVVDNNGDNNTCSTTVIVDNPLIVSIADVFAVNPGGNVNTIYIGYGPTALTLTATGSGGYLAPGHQYTYTWSTGATTPFISVSPSAPGTYNYTVTITDEYGCTAAVTKTITVADVRCGNKLDKVIVCQVPPGNPANRHEICVSKNAVAAHLKNGSYLGSCQPTSITGGNISINPIKEESRLTEKSIRVNPNPNNGYFTLQLNNLNVTEIKVLDQTGKVVYRKLVNKNLKAQTVTMNMGTMAKGVYTIQAIGTEGMTTTKMMIQ